MRRDAAKEAYSVSGYVIRQDLIDPSFCEYLANYLFLMSEIGRLEKDPMIDNAGFVYGDPAFDVLLAMLSPDVGEWVGHEVLPTYSFARVYATGSSLPRHRDRPACEHSVSLHLGSSGPGWPLYLTDLNGVTTDVIQSPGDALCYQGMRVEHWREVLPVGWHAQVFLHWVGSDGPNAEWRFDGRASLGRPSAEGDVARSQRDGR